MPEFNKKQALQFLNDARSNISPDAIKFMERYRKLADATYEDIGTSENEVAELRKQAA